jgi:flagellar basal body rod protein FlgG
MISALSASLSGISAGSARIHAAAHNVANLLTDDFRPARVTQSAVESGGTRVEVDYAAEPRPVEYAEEAVQMIMGSVQARASMRVLEVDLDLLGGLLDLEV